MTPNKEDYLKCIYEIGIKDNKITNKEIADRLNVSPPAVTEMTKKLINDNFLIKDSKLGYKLTVLGNQLVADLYRKHRLLEVFLVNNLNYNVDEVHEEAEVLEHTVSELFIDRLDELLNYPAICPHGGVIPKKKELIEEKYTFKLSYVKEIGEYKFVRVKDELQLLKYLESNNMKIGNSIKVTNIDEYAQVYTIKVNDKYIQISFAIAELMFVEKK